MELRHGLLAATLFIAASVLPINAEITKPGFPEQALRGSKNLETLLQNSGLCKQYPVVVKVSNNVAEIATYVDRQLSDNEVKVLTVRMSKLILDKAHKIAEVKVRLYDPASNKYWQNVDLSAAQIQGASQAGPGQEDVLNAIKVVNNFGLMDGPNLETRVGLYDHILELQRAGIDVQPFYLRFNEIETGEKHGLNVNAQMSQLNASLLVADPVEQPVSSNMMSSGVIAELQQEYAEASDEQTAASEALHKMEQKQADLTPNMSNDMDAQARYENDYEGLQHDINSALKDLHDAQQHRDLVYQQLKQAQIK